MVNVGLEGAAGSRAERGLGGEVGVRRLARRGTAAGAGRLRPSGCPAGTAAERGGVMGSNSHRARRRSRAGHLGQEQRGSAHRVADGRAPRPVIRGRRRPRARRRPCRPRRSPVAAAADGRRGHGSRSPSCGPPVRQLRGQGRPDHPVEARGVAEEERRPVAAELDQRERDAVGRRAPSRIGARSARERPRGIAAGEPAGGDGRLDGGPSTTRPSGREPGLLRGLRGPGPRRHVRRVGARRRGGVHPPGLADPARLGRRGRLVVRPVRRAAAPPVHPHRRGCTWRASCLGDRRREPDRRTGGGTVAAVNMFLRNDGRWRMVLHHGSPVAPRPDRRLEVRGKKQPHCRASAHRRAYPALCTREAIVDATIALLEDGDLRPTAPRVAERASVSVRSVFQHFDDLQSLHTAVAERIVDRVAVLVAPSMPRSRSTTGSTASSSSAPTCSRRSPRSGWRPASTVRSPRDTAGDARRAAFLRTGSSRSSHRSWPASRRRSARGDRGPGDRLVVGDLGDAAHGVGRRPRPARAVLARLVGPSWLWRRPTAPAGVDRARRRGSGSPAESPSARRSRG